MLAEDLLSLCLRIGELAFSATVAGLTGQYLHAIKGVRAWDKKRFIYTEIVAALGILVALMFLIPFASTFIHWPVDFVMFVLFMVAFGLLVNFIGPMDCGSVWNWNGITGKSECSKFKADIAFLFLASIFFFVSTLLGLYVIHRRRRAVTGATTHRRRWYRSNY